MSTYLYLHRWHEISWEIVGFFKVCCATIVSSQILIKKLITSEMKEELYMLTNPHS